MAVIGGIAVIARGVRRMTTDIDAVVRGDAATYEEVLRALAAHGVGPRIEDAEAFAASSLVLLLRHQPTGVDIDLSFGWTEFAETRSELCLRRTPRSSAAGRRPPKLATG